MRSPKQSEVLAHGHCGGRPPLVAGQRTRVETGGWTECALGRAGGVVVETSVGRGMAAHWGWCAALPVPRRKKDRSWLIWRRAARVRRALRVRFWRNRPAYGEFRTHLSI